MHFSFDRPESQVILHSLILEIGPESVSALREALAQLTDWSCLLKLSLDHAVFPSLYRRVADTCSEAVPPEVLADWLRLYKIHARRNLRITTELIQVLNLLEAHGIIAIPYKGPVLAAVAYGDIALRQFVDLDILVSRKDIGKVIDLLIPIGYRLRYSFTKKQEGVHLERAHEFTFEHSQRTMLDVHFRFAADYLGGGPDPGEAIARRVPVQVLGKTVYSLHPEDNLLMLCQHGTFHFWLKLGLVSDVAYLIGSQAHWDWPGLLQRAKDLGMRRQVLLGLSRAQELLQAPVPPKVIREADTEPSLVYLRRWVMKNMFSRSEADLGFFKITSFYLQTRDCFKDRLTLVFIRLFIPSVEDWRWVPLPDSCYWLYYLIRPLRLGLQGLVLPLLRRFQVLSRRKAVHSQH